MASVWSTLWSSEETHPLVLFRILTQKYGPSWIEWDLPVLRQSIVKDGATPARVNLSKALATAALAQRDEFWQEWEVFHFIAQALNNNIPTATELQELTVGQMMTAVDIAETLRKDLKTLSYIPPYTEEVARFVASSSLNQGVWYLPSPLDFAAPFAAGKRYKCRDCGTDSEVVYDDGICDVCTERWNTDTLRDWKPNPKLLKKGLGTNVEVYEKNPTDKVRARLEKAVSSNITLQENQTDVCVARLLVAIQYAALRRQQQLDQLGLLQAAA